MAKRRGRGNRSAASTGTNPCNNNNHGFSRNRSSNRGSHGNSDGVLHGKIWREEVLGEILRISDRVKELHNNKQILHQPPTPTASIRYHLREIKRLLKNPTYEYDIISCSSSSSSSSSPSYSLSLSSSSSSSDSSSSFESNTLSAWMSSEDDTTSSSSDSSSSSSSSSSFEFNTSSSRYLSSESDTSSSDSSSSSPSESDTSLSSQFNQHYYNNRQH